MNQKKSKQEKSKKGQLTIFIILAILIVVVVAIVFFDNIKQFVIPVNSPSLMSKDCIQSAVKDAVNQTLSHGGNINPELYFRYNNITLNYLCYTQEWYKTCIMQVPLLKQEMENQVNSLIQTKVQKCISDTEQKLIARNYAVKTSGTKKVTVTFVPKNIQVNVDVAMTLSKSDSTENYPGSVFSSQINSNAYDLIMIASSIQNYEARYGDSAPETYMGLYPNIKIQKLKQSDGSKVYIISDRESKETLSFATRSLAWPPGYALS